MTGVHEVCDDGNTVSGDGCSSDCMSVERCGDGVINPGEECDGADVGGLHCSGLCRLERCGNGILDPGEQCDDGAVNGVNLNQDSAVCTSTCQINTCGDGKVLQGIEQCDSGGIDIEGCDSDCTKPVCGDGHLNTANGEACDDGAFNGRSPSNCNQFCQVDHCGNGILEPGEQCDDGTDNHEGARCNQNCQLNVCGDGDKLEGVEQCDPGRDAFGNLKDTRTCDHDCTLPVCGDGLVNMKAHEECDDGNASTCGTCSAIDCKASPIAPTQATITITTSDGGQIDNGDTDDFIKLDDGFGNVLTFEFTTGSTTIPGAFPIPFVKSPTADGAAAIASNMAAAIHSQAQQGFGIDASVPVPPGDPTTVTLTNKRKSSLGNKPITFTGLPNFVFGNGTPQLAGGLAGDCVADTGCATGNDCISNFCNSSKQCQACTSDSQCGSPDHCNVAIGRCE